MCHGLGGKAGGEAFSIIKSKPPLLLRGFEVMAGLQCIGFRTRFSAGSKGLLIGFEFC